MLNFLLRQVNSVSSGSCKLSGVSQFAYASANLFVTIMHMWSVDVACTWSTWLYLAMSLCSVLSMIMATMPDRKSTMTKEFMILKTKTYINMRECLLIKNKKKKK